LSGMRAAFPVRGMAECAALFRPTSATSACGESGEAFAQPIDHCAGGGVALEVILDEKPDVLAALQRRSCPCL
jgi:hypothetical protein